MDNLVWAEQEIRELKERVKELERILINAKDENTERILEEFKVPSRVKIRVVSI